MRIFYPSMIEVQLKIRRAIVMVAPLRVEEF